MSTFVHYVPEQRSLDLAQLSEQDFVLIRSMYGQIKRGDRYLLCEQTLSDDGDGSEMYVKQRNGRYYAAHFPGSTCTQEHEIVQESDEHRRQKDYWQRAAEFAGYPAEQELRTGNGTTLDVAIDGPRRTGIEVQHSALRTNLAKSRSTRSFRAGWLPVWFLDSDHTPPWFHAVPAVNCNVRLPWSESLPPRRHGARAEQIRRDAVLGAEHRYVPYRHPETSETSLRSVPPAPRTVVRVDRRRRRRNGPRRGNRTDA